MSTPPSKFFNRYEFDEDVRDERDRLRAVNGQLLAAAEEGLSALERAAKGGLAYKITRNQLRAAIAEAQKATGGQ